MRFVVPFDMVRATASLAALGWAASGKAINQRVEPLVHLGRNPHPAASELDQEHTPAFRIDKAAVGRSPSMPASTVPQPAHVSRKTASDRPPHHGRIRAANTAPAVHETAQSAAPVPARTDRPADPAHVGGRVASPKSSERYRPGPRSGLEGKLAEKEPEGRTDQNPSATRRRTNTTVAPRAHDSRTRSVSGRGGPPCASTAPTAAISAGQPPGVLTASATDGTDRAMAGSLPVVRWRGNTVDQRCGPHPPYLSPITTASHPPVGSRRRRLYPTISTRLCAIPEMPWSQGTDLIFQPMWSILDSTLSPALDDPFLGHPHGWPDRSVTPRGRPHRSSPWPTR